MKKNNIDNRSQNFSASDGDIRKPWDIKGVPFIAFIGKYLNVPTWDERIVNDSLGEVICIIGKNYGTGKCIDYKKGIRYLKKQIPGCSVRNIKLMLCSVPNFILREARDSKFVLRFSIDSYVKVIAKIVEIMDENHALFFDSMQEGHIQPMPPNLQYSELLLSQALVKLRYVQAHGRPPKVRIATNILNGIANVANKNICNTCQRRKPGNNVVPFCGQALCSVALVTLL
ncbi:MAG: hypothetical protein LBH43_20685 [Treponema sp.]|jgi:hypothetical protein|nr:hypothetical protein [Treponema sp.]